MSKPLNVQRCRDQFPGLARKIDGRPAVFFDGPAGSQVPRRVIDAMGRYLAEINANSGGSFVTSSETEDLLDRAHRAGADLLGADDPQTVIFGANMTSLAMMLARSLAQVWKPGDEIILSRLDHDANVTPWIQAANDSGAEVRYIDVREEDCTLDLADLEGKINERTRFVAVGAASNAVGTINPVRKIADLTHSAGALLFVDAVHYAPHGLIDVNAWDCDFVACSAYKFYGPHVGMLWGRRRLLEALPAYKLRPAPDGLPGRWMNGTQSHEGIAGTLEAIDYLADLGRGTQAAQSPRRQALQAAFGSIVNYETELAGRLLEMLAGVPGVRVRGITDPQRSGDRVPTVSFTHDNLSPGEIAERLGAEGIFVWHGNYYALPLTEALGLEPEGMVRVGLMHYNLSEEIDRLQKSLERLA